MQLSPVQLLAFAASAICVAMVTTVVEGIESGQPCWPPLPCDSSLSCLPHYNPKNQSGLSGVCQRILGTPGSLGESCASSGAKPCLFGLECQGFGMDAKCVLPSPCLESWCPDVTPVGPGEVCSASARRPCDSPYVCVPHYNPKNVIGMSGICMGPRQAGLAASLGGGCAISGESPCLPGLICQNVPTGFKKANCVLPSPCLEAWCPDVTTTATTTKKSSPTSSPSPNRDGSNQGGSGSGSGGNTVNGDTGTATSGSEGNVGSGTSADKQTKSSADLNRFPMALYAASIFGGALLAVMI